MVSAVCLSIFLLHDIDFVMAQQVSESATTQRIHDAVISLHDDVIKWKHFPRNWPFVRGIHRAPVNSPHKGQ